MKKLSPFSAEFWIQKGFSEEEAEYKRNSLRPIRKEYWLEKGFSEERAIEKAIETKKENNIKGAKKSASRTKEEFYKGSVRRKEYWIEKGFLEEEAIEKVKEIQKNGSLENYIKRYGLENGTLKWKERQIKWQNTINSKTQKEKDEINASKNAYSLEKYNNIDEAISDINKIRNTKLVKSISEYRNVLIEKYKNNNYIFYMPFDVFLEKYVPKTQIKIFEELNIDIYDVKDMFLEGKDFLIKTGNKQAYRRWEKEGLLRSSYEIYFYDKFKNKFPEKEIIIDKNYPQSNFRYDFLIDDNYIEICPLINSNEKYKQKMLKKQKLFGSILLSDINQIDKFIDGYNEINS